MSKLIYLRESLEALEKAEEKTAKTRRQYNHQSREYEHLDYAEVSIENAIRIVKSILEDAENDTYSNMMRKTYKQPEAQ